MPQIRTSSDLRNRYEEISDYCHKSSEPVYIIRNGAEDLAVMSAETCKRLTARQEWSARLELYALLEKGLADERAGRLTPAEDVFAELEKDMEDGAI